MRDQLLKRLADSPVGALVPAVAGIRAITWGDRLTKAGFPAIVLTQIAPGRDYAHDGPDGLDGPLVQADVMARTNAALNALATALIAEMESQDDVAVGGVTVRFHHGFVVGDQGPMAEDLGAGAGGAGSDARVLRRVIEFEIPWEFL